MNFLLASASRGLPSIPGQPTVVARNFNEVFLILGAMGLVIGLVLIWAVFIRKPKVDKRAKVLEPYVEDEPRSSSGKKRRRKRRRAHRPRNPTLAETGGLPPPKNDDADKD